MGPDLSGGETLATGTRISSCVQSELKWCRNTFIEPDCDTYDVENASLAFEPNEGGKIIRRYRDCFLVELQGTGPVTVVARGKIRSRQSTHRLVPHLLPVQKHAQWDDTEPLLVGDEVHAELWATTANGMRVPFTVTDESTSSLHWSEAKRASTILGQSFEQELALDMLQH